jgi:hypothetical protein
MRRTRRPTPSTRASALAAVLLSLALGACQGQKRRSTASAPRCTDAEAGTLRVTNQSGRMIEIHTWRPTSPQRVFVGTASPGTTTFRVEGPADLDVRYAALDPTRGTLFATVSWLRPHARGGSSQVLLDLDCVSTR